MIRHRHASYMYTVLCVQGECPSSMAIDSVYVNLHHALVAIRRWQLFEGGISDLQTGKAGSVIHPEKGLLVLQWMAEYVLLVLQV